jgi:hypothetical protein
VKHRRTISSAAKRERQAFLRRAAICFRRAVHSEAARSGEVDAGDSLVRCSLRIVELPRRATFFEKISGMKNLVPDLLF